MDFRVGGREFNSGGPKGGTQHRFSAVYHDIVPGRRILYSYDMHLDERRISVSLATMQLDPEGSGTRLTFTEQGAFLDGYDIGSREHGTRPLLDALGAERRPGSERMSPKLYFHPLASFCHKVLIAFYENGTPFEPVIVDFGDPASTAAFRAVWPMAKMPVLRDEARASTVAESTILIEYLDLHYPGAVRLLPGDPDAAWRTRMWDRFFDNYVHLPMQKITGDRLRPPADRDAFGVAQAREQLRQAYAAADRELGSKRWMTGEEFSLADCAAAPALFYANVVEEIAPANGILKAYLERLMSRPSYARVLSEAAPFVRNFPFAADLGERYPGLYP